jgi:hypothetical protein
MSAQDGGPAFPFFHAWEVDKEGADGMSLRDYFAAKAMQGFCASASMPEWEFSDMAKQAYCAADAMLRAREQKP